MSDRFDECLPRVLQHEGGFVDHPDDPGGATNQGITLATYQRHFPNGTVAALKAIGPTQVAEIYRKDYWGKVRADDLPRGLDYAVFDFAVNSGPGRAAKFLQRLVSVTDDGAIGPVTLRAIQSYDTEVLIRRLCQTRLDWLHGLRHFATFGNGWTRRVNEVEMDAKTDLARPAPKPKPKPVPWWFRLVNILKGK